MVASIGIGRCSLALEQEPTDRTETTARRKTNTCHIEDTARLRTATVRVEVGVSQRLIESKQTRIRVDCLRVVSIIGTEDVSLSGREQRTSRIQSNDRVQLSILVFAGVRRYVRSQAVPDQINVVTGCTGRGHDRVNHTRNDLTDGTDPIARRNVVDRLRTCAPVHVHDVELADANVVILDGPVQTGVLALQESVDEEARRVRRIEVAVRHRTLVVPGDDLRVDRIATRVQPENDVRFGVKERLDVGITLRHLVRVGADQMHTPGCVRNQHPWLRLQRSRTGNGNEAEHA
uniref:Uncharacterized protein n=1 Tax=Anopheles farauti TaxID=69004 RepID=A0A182Q794_9DIPT